MEVPVPSSWPGNKQGWPLGSSAVVSFSPYKESDLGVVVLRVLWFSFPQSFPV